MSLVVKLWLLALYLVVTDSWAFLPRIMIKSNRACQIICGFVFANVGIQPNHLSEIMSEHNPIPIILSANADSTGKMSTKLTARKRYLPRILKAANKFAEMKDVKADSKASKDFFSSEEYTDLLRAMNLYGLSLRKGEYPDEVSKQAGELTDNFAALCNEYSKIPNGERLLRCLTSFDDYVKFARVEVP